MIKLDEYEVEGNICFIILVFIHCMATENKKLIFINT
jgi:hypothetical protein